MSEFDASTTQQDATGFHQIRIVIDITEIDDFPNSCLDDHLSTLGTWEKSDVYCGSFDIGTALVENSVELRVADVEVFVMNLVLIFSGPRKRVIGATRRESIVTQTDNPLFIVDDTSPDLSVRIFRAFGSEEGHGHA